MNANALRRFLGCASLVLPMVAFAQTQTVLPSYGPWMSGISIGGIPAQGPPVFQTEAYCAAGESREQSLTSLLDQWNPRRPYWYGSVGNTPLELGTCVEGETNPVSSFGYGGTKCPPPSSFVVTSWCAVGPEGVPDARPNWALWKSIQCPAGYVQSVNPDGSWICIIREEAVCPIGNPVSPVTGTKFHEEVDYKAEGLGALRLRRYYFSGAYLQPGAAPPLAGPIADHWRTEYDHRLISVTSPQPLTILQLPSGQRRHFNDSGFEILNRDGAASRVETTMEGGWLLTLPSSDAEQFDASGRLIALVSLTGVTTTIARDPSGRISTVTDHFGRSLTYGYDTEGRLATITIPGGQQIVYGYDDLDRLITVTYPGNATRTYRYESPRYGGWLTGITDENNVRFATYTYSNSGQVTVSEHAGGANRYEFTYSPGTNPSTVVRDPLGTDRTYNMSTVAGVYKLSNVQGGQCQSCGPSQAVIYDTQGNVTRRSDFRGNRTTYQYNARKLETSRTEALNSTGATTPLTRTITTDWHPTFRLPTLITEPSGIPGVSRVTTLSYDVEGNLELETVTVGSETRQQSYTYDGLGRQLTHDRPRTDVLDISSTTYYADNDACLGCRGQPHTLTNAAGHVTTIEDYNVHGQPLRVSDPNGIVTILGYDARQHLTSLETAGELTTYTYYDTGLLKRVTLPDGSFVEHVYDDAHRLTRLFDGEANEVIYQVDAMGNRTREDRRDPSGTVSLTRRWIYDTLNRLSQQLGTADQTTSFSYDADGNPDTTTDPRDRITDENYDALNRLMRVTDPQSGATVFSYDASDNVRTVTDPRTVATTYDYNGFGDLLSVASPDSGLTEYVPDTAGNVVLTTDARNREGEHHYDVLNRVTAIEYTDQTLTFEYDVGTNANGYLNRIANSAGSTQWTFNAQGRVATQQQTVGAVTLTTSYGYDAGGRLNQITTPSGQVIGYGHANGRIASVTVNGQPLLNQVLYEPFGPTRGWSWANGTFAIRDYDTDWQVTAIDSGGLSTYTYYPDGTIQSRTDETPSALNIANGTTFSTIATDSNRLLSTQGAGAQTWVYDEAGNVTQRSGALFAYNNAGRMSSATAGGVTTDYLVNALGQRVRKSNTSLTRLFVYDESGSLLGEYDGTGALVQETIWFDDIPVATLRPNGGSAAVFYVHTDHLNTPRRISRPSDNAILWRWDSDPFGQVSPNEDADGDLQTFQYNLRFPGQYFDVETGLYYNYFRDYDPAIGRYVQSDPIGLGGGVNTYAYVVGNPVSHFDAFGLLCEGKWVKWGEHTQPAPWGWTTIPVYCACYWMCVPCRGPWMWDGNMFGLPSTRGRTFVDYSGSKPPDVGSGGIRPTPRGPSRGGGGAAGGAYSCLCTQKPGAETGCNTGTCYRDSNFNE